MGEGVVFRRFPVLLIVFAITTFLAACKTAEDFYGSGPITMTPKIKKFVDRYTTVGQSTIVAVRTDGKRAHAAWCGALACSGGGEEFMALDGCESKGGKCWIYAMNGYVVWKGPVTVSGQGGATATKLSEGLGQYSDKIICKFAIDRKGSTPKWNENSWKRFNAYEAKRRGLTVADCLKY